MSGVHHSVLLTEAVEALVQNPDGLYLDGTFGRGGHTQAILDSLSAKGRLLIFDKDPEAILVAEEMAKADPRITVFHDSFAKMQSVCQTLNCLGKVQGVLLDLGVSSPQLDDDTRGFSFLRDGPLDMRMDPTQGLDAKTWVEQASQDEMVTVFKEYGEERFAKRIAGAIVNSRAKAPICTTSQLAKIVKEAHPKWEKHKHPATRVFQAIRIFINKELDDLQAVLPQTLSVLAPGGRLVVVSFHSLEDRIVKRFLRQESQGVLPKGLPVTADELQVQLRVVGKKSKASTAELAHNPRARSAVMRVGEKLQ